MLAADQSSIRPRVSAIVALFGYALLVRVMPYMLHVAFGINIEFAYAAFPWNFSPMFALAIFGGAFFGPRLAIVLPLAIHFAGDVLTALLMGSDWGFYRDQPFTYAALAALALCGMSLRHRQGVLPVVAVGLGGAIAFFVVTNFGVWVVGGGFSRPYTIAGLIQCYIDALPFFTPTLVSLAVFLPVLFSPLVLAAVGDRSIQAETAL